MNIGIDIDGVLFPWTDVANEAVVEHFDVPDPGPHQRWEWLKECITSGQWAWLWSAVGQDIVFSHDRVYPDVVEAFNALLRNPAHRCHFVTHRDPRRTAVHTANFLSRHFGGHPWAGVHVVQGSVAKCELMEWDVFIDDKPETVREMLAFTQAMVFTPARPWNEELARIHTPRLIRYRDPWTIVRWVEERS